MGWTADNRRVVIADDSRLMTFLDRVPINVSHLWRHEAFTLAAIARESVPHAYVEIQGTDLDQRMVERARTGRFTAEDARTAPPALLKKWFDPVDDRVGRPSPSPCAWRASRSATCCGCPSRPAAST